MSECCMDAWHRGRWCTCDAAVAIRRRRRLAVDAVFERAGLGSLVPPNFARWEDDGGLTK